MVDELISDVLAVEGVEDLHHVHVWELDEQHRALEAHVAIAHRRSADLEAIKRRVRQCLADNYQIRHSTLEFEFGDSPDEAHDRAVIPNQ